MEGAANSRTNRGKNLVGFSVGEVHYAVDILRVQEIINPLDLVALPHAPPVVVGVSEHRGEVLPVIDMRRRFGLPSAEASRRTKWIVVRVASRPAALVVDSVTDVFGAGTGQERDVPALGVNDAARGIAAVYLHEQHLVFVIDVDRVASPAEAIDLHVASELTRGEEA